MRESVYIGPAGWSYPDWDGAVYPSKKPRGFDALVYISSYFNLVEINSTFYKPPAPSTCERWCERVSHNPDFRFTLKAHRRFTHSTEPLEPREFEGFKRTIRPMQDVGVLLCVLLQFPWSFKDTASHRRRLRELIAGFDPVPVALEVRHGSWARDPGFGFLKSTGVTVCRIDQPLIGDSVTPRTHIDAGVGAYFRFHGRNRREWFRSGANRDSRYNYLYSASELSPFVAAIAHTAETASRTVVVMNNHFRGQAVANALELKSMLLKRKVAVPGSLIEAYPRLESFAAPDPNAPPETGDLFGAPD